MGNGQTPSTNKEKGKERFQDGLNADKAAPGEKSLLVDIFQSAKSSVTPSTLASIAVGTGKSTSSLPSFQNPPSQSFEVQHTTPPDAFAGNARLPPAAKSERQGDLSELGNINTAYEQFENTHPRSFSSIEPATDSTLVGPYSSTDVLDIALHRHVQAESSRMKNMDNAWNDSLGKSNHQKQGFSFPEAWKGDIQASVAELYYPFETQKGEYLDHLLQTVDSSDQAPILAHLHANTNANTSKSIFDLLDDEEQQSETSTYAYDDKDLSKEQRAMHDRLHALQKSDSRAEKIIRPPGDDPVARTGVYAANPIEALEAIWDGTSEGERASAVIRESSISESDLPRRIREILQRGSYVDDVYGLPPQLERTIISAEEEETEENKDRKAKAIQRLEALYRHLGAAAATTSQIAIEDYVRQW